MMWDEKRLREEVELLRRRRGDSTAVEAKLAAGGLPRDLARTVCAFGNVPDGGTILLGIDENANFAFIGVSNPAAMEAALVDQARKKVSPVPYIKTTVVEVGGKPIVVAEVTPLRLADRPSEVEGRAYLRQADGNYAMHEHELRMIETQKLLLDVPHDFDRRAVEGLTIDDLVPELVDEYIRQTRISDRRLSSKTDLQILRSTGVVLAAGELSLAGLYALGDYPQGAFPSLTVTAAVQLPSQSGARNRALEHFTGPVPVLLADLMQWCETELSSVRRYRDDGHMVEEPEIPLRAVREILANALVHRDLGPNTVGVGRSIQVRLTPNRLFIQSPGGLRGVSTEQLLSEEHAQSAVNQRLYNMAKKLSTADGAFVIEGEGGGIREVLQSTRTSGLQTPTLINTGVQFTALLWRPDSPDVERLSSPMRWEQSPIPLTKNAPAILDLLSQRKALSFADLRSESGLTGGQLRYALTKLVEAGEVKMVGAQGRRDTKYRIP